MQDLEIGRIYNVNHSRKGKFQIELTHVDSEFLTGVILFGKASSIGFGAGYSKGDEITFRKSLAVLTLVK